MTTTNTTLHLAIGCYNESIAAIASFGELFADPSLHDHDESDTCQLDELTDDDKSSILARLMHRVETFVDLMPAALLPDDEMVQLFRNKTAGTHRLEISRENLLPLQLTTEERRGVYETLLALTSSDMQEMNATIFDGVDMFSLPEELALQRIKEFRAGHPADSVWMGFLIISFETLNQALSIISLARNVRDVIQGGVVPRG